MVEDFEAAGSSVTDLAQKVALLLRLADWHLQRDELAAAQEKLEQALAVDPTSMAAVRRLASC